MDEGRDTGSESEGDVTGTINRQQATNAMEMGRWRKARRKKKYKIVDRMTSSWLRLG